MPDEIGSGPGHPWRDVVATLPRVQAEDQPPTEACGEPPECIELREAQRLRRGVGRRRSVRDERVVLHRAAVPQQRVGAERGAQPSHRRVGVRKVRKMRKVLVRVQGEADERPVQLVDGRLRADSHNDIVALDAVFVG